MSFHAELRPLLALHEFTGNTIDELAVQKDSALNGKRRMWRAIWPETQLAPCCTCWYYRTIGMIRLDVRKVNIYIDRTGLKNAGLWHHFAYLPESKVFVLAAGFSCLLSCNHDTSMTRSDTNHSLDFFH